MTDSLEIRYSDDGGYNYSKARFLPLGETGDFVKPLIARRLGFTRQRQFEIVCSANRRVDVLAAAVQVEGEL